MGSNPGQRAKTPTCLRAKNSVLQFIFGPEASGGLSSLTRIGIHTPALEGEVLTTELLGKFLGISL